MAGSLSTEASAQLDYSRTAVPASGRMPRFSLTMAWWSCCSAMFFIVVAWVAVALAYMLKDAKYAPIDAGGKSDDAYPAFNARGLIAWFSAVAVGIVLMNLPALASFSAPGSAVTGFVLYWLLGAKPKLATA